MTLYICLWEKKITKCYFLKEKMSLLKTITKVHKKMYKTETFRKMDRFITMF